MADTWRWVLSCSNDASEFEIPDEPMDWQDYAIEIHRDPKVHGKIITMTNSLTFYEDNAQDVGYSFIKEKYDNYGIAADITLQVFVSCDGSDEQQLPDARLNLSDIQFEEGEGCFVTVPMEEAGCVMQFKNRQDLKVDLLSLDTVDDPGVESLEPYDSIGVETNIPSKAVKVIDKMYYDDTSGVSSITKEYDHTTDGPVPLSIFFWLRQSEIINEIGGLDENYLTGALVSTSAATVPNFWTHENVPYPSGDIAVDGLYHVTLAIEVILDNVTLNGGTGSETFKDVTVNLILRVTHTDGTFDLYTLGTDSFPGYHDNTFSEELSYPLTTLATFPTIPSTGIGDVYAMYLHVEIAPSYTIINPLDPVLIEFFENVTDFHDSNINFHVLTFFPVTAAKLSFVNESLSRITEKLTGDCLRVYSSYFGSPTSQPYDRENPEINNELACDEYGECYGCGHGFSITNGLLLRRVEDAKCFISFRELYDSLNSIFCIGMGVEDDPFRPGMSRLRIEQAQFFYEDDQMDYFIEFPDKISRTVKLDTFYCNLIIGYLQWESEAFSSLDDFFSQRQYTSNITQIGGDKSLLSSVIASNYAAEFTRQQKQNTADWKYDNSIFIFEGDRVANSPDVITGEAEDGSDVIDPGSVYNVEISPLVNALRWFKFLFSIFKDNLAADSILNFVSGTGNYDAIIQRAPTIDECQLYEAGFYAENKNLDYTILEEYADNPPILGFESWTLDYPMSFAEYVEVKDNFYKQVPVLWSNDVGIKYAYIEQMNWRPAQGMATFRLIRKWEEFSLDSLWVDSDGSFVVDELGDFILTG